MSVIRAGSKVGIEIPESGTKTNYGTLGAVLERGGDLFVLTNGHVVDWEMEKELYLYDEGSSPWGHKLLGKVEAVTSEDDVGDGLDGAAVRLDNPRDWEFDYAINTKKISGVGEADDGDKVMMQGATTGIKEEVAVRETHAKTKMKSRKIGEIKDVIELSFRKRQNYAEAGDSGSLVVAEKSMKAVGLFFMETTNFGYACRLQKVLDKLTEVGGKEDFLLKTEK